MSDTPTHPGWGELPDEPAADDGPALPYAEPAADDEPDRKVHPDDAAAAEARGDEPEPETAVDEWGRSMAPGTQR